MKTARDFHGHIVLFAIAVLTAATASARTVYDAGKAFKANCTATSGAYANPYTDANGGKWSYFITALSPVANTVTLNSGSYSWNNGGTFPLKGFASDNTKQATSIRVNTSAVAATLLSGEVLQPEELVLFPGNSDSQRACVRFTVPEDGWYSAFVSAHDLVKETGAASANSGVEVRILAQGNLLVSQIVSLEEYASGASTHRFDFQMPVRHLAAGETIDVLVSRNGANSSDNTGVAFIVTKEDEGAFYDSGIAMTNCVANAATYINPYGTIKDGTWYYLKTTVPSSSVDFVSWAPENFSHGSGSRISENATRSGGLKGFGNNASGQSPYVVVNSAASVSSDNTAPCELQAHPYGNDATVWTTIRFRPPVSGYFSGSVVARDLNKGGSNANGVDVYLLVSEHVVTNAYISAETFSATARLAFDVRLLAAGEPVDIVISSHGQASSDATAISSIFRREEGTVYDAGKSYYEEHASNRCSNYFSDTLGGGAKWLLSAKSDSWAEAHSALGTYLTPAGNKLSWWTHAVNTSNNGTAPRFAMAANGTANVDSLYITTSLLLATTPFELVVQPAATASTSLRAEVPSDGIYRVRSYIRALNNNSNGNGVRAIVSAGGCAPSSVVVSRANNTAPFEAALAADRLWMKQGEALYFTVDPMNDPTSDATALSACYEKASDATAQVINIDIAGSGSGRRSDFTGRGREGWGTAWNALRPGAASSAIVKNCREDDGTKCNISLSITRSSGAAIATASGSTDCAMLDSAVSSSGADDAYSFTLSELVPNAAYSLYFYGTGDASFTVGGETKGLEEPWCAKEANALARFNVSADANGEISGTFYATSASGAAFGGLTIVGEFPDYEPQGMLIIFK